MLSFFAESIGFVVLTTFIIIHNSVIAGAAEALKLGFSGSERNTVGGLFRSGAEVVRHLQRERGINRIGRNHHDSGFGFGPPAHDLRSAVKSVPA